MANPSYLRPVAENELLERAPPFLRETRDYTGEIGLRQVFATLWRRKMIVLSVMVIVTTLVLLWVMQVVPLYVSEARIVVETRRENVVNIDSVIQGVRPDFYTNETEAAVIASRSLAGKVVDTLDLTHHPLFNPDLGPAKVGFVTKLIEQFQLAEMLGPLAPDWFSPGDAPAVEDDRDPLSPADEAAWYREYAIDTFLYWLEVVPGERSRVISILFTSEDPELAALAANTLADLYILESVNLKLDATSRASRFLKGQVAELRARYQESERALEAFRRDLGIVDFGNQRTLLTEQLAELNRQLIDARTGRSAAEARYKQVQRMLNSAGGIEAAAAVLDSPLIQRLREQEAQVVREIAELRSTLRERHPRLILKRNELADLRQNIQTEINKIGVGLGNELELAKIREQDLEREFARLKAEIKAQTNAEVTLRGLQSDSDANKALYETVLARFKEIDVQEQGPQQPDARLISSAVIPEFPSFPRKKLILAVALMGSALLGMALVFVVEHLDSGFRSLQQLSQRTGVPGIALMPRLSGAELRRTVPEDLVIDKPNSRFAEAVRTIRTALLLSNVDNPPKSVMVTSSVPGEGKTLTAVSLARAAALAGQRTIIVDCDLRQPSVHGALGVENQRGVVECLIGEVTPDEAVEIDTRTGLHYLTAGSHAPNPPDLLGSEAMHRLLGLLTRSYDLVVIDTPPVLPVADSMVLVRQVDKALFLVRWGTTRRETAMEGLGQIANSPADLAGVVLTQVDMREHARYHYSDSQYYAGGFDRNYVQ